METVWLKATQQLAAIEGCADGLLKETPAAGLSLKQVHVLNALYIRNGQKASELAHAVGVAPTSFTPILDSVQRRGFIERQADKDDRRSVSIHLTPSGESLRADIQFALEQLGAAFESHSLLPE